VRIEKRDLKVPVLWNEGPDSKCRRKPHLHRNSERSGDLGCADNPSVIVLTIDWQGSKISDCLRESLLLLRHKVHLQIERVALEGRLEGHRLNAEILLGSDKLRNSSERGKCLIFDAEPRTVESKGRLVHELSTPWGTAHVQKRPSLVRWVYDTLSQAFSLTVVDTRQKPWIYLIYNLN